MSLEVRILSMCEACRCTHEYFENNWPNFKEFAAEKLDLDIKSCTEIRLSKERLTALIEEFESKYHSSKDLRAAYFDMVVRNKSIYLEVEW